MVDTDIHVLKADHTKDANCAAAKNYPTSPELSKRTHTPCSSTVLVSRPTR